MQTNLKRRFQGYWLIELFQIDSYDICRALTDNGIKIILLITETNENIDEQDMELINNWNKIYEELEKYTKNLSKN